MKIFLIVCFAMFAAGCSGAGAESEPMETHAVPDALYVSCTSVVDTVPNDDCSAGQLTVQRCSSATDNPDRENCTGPAVSPTQATGTVWCCSPAAKVTH